MGGDKSVSDPVRVHVPRELDVLPHDRVLVVPHGDHMTEDAGHDLIRKAPLYAQVDGTSLGVLGAVMTEEFYKIKLLHATDLGKGRGIHTHTVGIQSIRVDTGLGLQQHVDDVEPIFVVVFR